MGLLTMRLLLLLLCLLPLAPAWAQILPAEPAVGAATEVVPDSFGRDTPRGTVEGFVAAIASDDASRAARYLDIANPNSPDAAEAVRDLRTALDRMGQLRPTAEISNVPTGDTSDALREGIDVVGALGTGEGRIDLKVHRIERDDRMIWVIHPDTLLQLPGIVAGSEVGLVERWSPNAFADFEWRGAPVSDWLAVPVLALGALAAGFAVSWLVAWIIGSVWLLSRRRRGRDFVRDADGMPRNAKARFLIRARRPVALLLATAWFRALGVATSLSIVARREADFFADLIFLIALAWLAFVVIDAVARNARNGAAARSLASVTSIVSLASKLAKAVVFLFAVFIGLDMWGFDVTTGLAALGIGGLAVALGAQKTVENLVGSVTLVADQPIRIGEFCKFGDVIGTVEDIGIRSTKVRTLDQTLVTIPNGAFSSMQIENYTRRSTYLFRHYLNVPYGTSAATVRALVTALLEYLNAHPQVIRDDSTRVNFFALAADNLSVDCFAMVRGPLYTDFLQIQQEMLFDVMDIFEAHGVGFAFPTRTVMLENGTADPANGRDPARGQDPKPQQDPAEVPSE